MADFINIHTNNLSRELRNNVTYDDNWVFVPGNTITGDPNRFYEFTSLSQFQETCGSHGPEDSRTYLYVAGLLNAGLPVLFKRITMNNKGNEVKEVVKAKAEFQHTSGEESITDFTVYEKYGGTYGNDLTVELADENTSWWLRVYLNDFTLLENVKLMDYTEAEKAEKTEYLAKLKSALETVVMDKVEVQIPVDIGDKFDPITQRIKLAGGEDLEDSDVRAMLPDIYVDLEDMVLFNPKFITSGGYCDLEGEDNAIANAMKNLTLKRQDCRALIDLPRSTAEIDYITEARKLKYNQSTNTEAIPSASMCGPWVYMGIGSELQWMPPSFAYLMVVGNCLSKGGKVYTPKAGLSNGAIPNILRTEFEIGAVRSKEWLQDGDTNINPIMKVRNGSYVINGNSTLLTVPNTIEENAFQESSADLTVIEIRRQVYNIASELQYQYNATTAFETFSLRTAKLLDAMKSEGAVTNYDIENVSTNDDPRTLKVRLDVYLTPTIKNIEIFLNISYGNVTISGGEA